MSIYDSLNDQMNGQLNELTSLNLDVKSVIRELHRVLYEGDLVESTRLRIELAIDDLEEISERLY